MNWDSLIRDAVPSPCYERPFVCEGLPSTSTMIVIGENPATPMSVDWWTYWDAKKGFDYERFVADYLQQRAAMGKGISNTRRRLDRIRGNGVQCVETNAFRNESLHGAGDGAPNFDVLNLLVEHMPDLTAILAHGRVATEFLNQVAVPVDVRRYETRHFRMESYDRIDEICAEVAGKSRLSG